MSGTNPGAGLSGSSRLIGGGAEPRDGRRRYGFRVAPTNQELLDWIVQARDLARASPHPHLDEPASIFRTLRASLTITHTLATAGSDCSSNLLLAWMLEASWNLRQTTLFSRERVGVADS